MTPVTTRLAIVNPYLQGGGAEYQIACMIQSLQVTGRYDITYLARYAQGAATAPCRVLPIRDERPVSWFGYLPDAPALLRALGQVNPDVIYQRVACAYTGIAAWYARRHKCRMVWHVAHDSDVIPGAYTSGRNPLRRRLEKGAIEYGLRNAHAIIVQTSQQAELLQRHYGREPTAIIPNFHPLPTVAPVKSAEPLIVWVANIKPMKRPEAFVQLAQALGDIAGARFVMIGSNQSAGSEQRWSEDLLAQIASTPNLQYLGGLSQHEVNEWLAKAHVFVNTSEQEGFPNTFIQAWLRQTFVCSLTVDPDHLLAEGGMGLHAGSIDRLIAGVRALLNDGPARERMASQAAQNAREMFSLQNVSRVAQVLESR